MIERKEDSRRKSLVETHPELCREWNYKRNGNLKPEDVTAGSGRKVWWLLPYDDKETGKHFDFEWVATICNRSQKNSGCPFLSGHSVWPGFNDLATTYPELSKEWNYKKNGVLRPENVTGKSGRKVWWLLPYNDPKTGKYFNFEWQATIANRAMSGHGCPFLALSTKAWSGFNDLATTHPELCKEWNYKRNGDLKPEDLTAGCHKKVWWLLPYDDSKSGKHFDFEWQESIINRTKGNGCPFLSSHQTWPGFNDLATTHPELCKEWNYKRNGALRPENVTGKSGRKVWWLLPYDDPKTGKHFDFEWKEIVANRTKGCNCPYLSGNKVMSGFNDLVTTHPDLCKEWNYKKNSDLRPENVTACSNKKVWWILPYDDPESGKHFDFEWTAIINNRSTKGSECPYLSNQMVFAGFNDLATTYPHLCKEWDYIKNGTLKPQDVPFGSHKKVWWKCSICGHEWQAIIGNRTKGIGCLRCARLLSVSRPECSVFYYVSKVDPSAVQTYLDLGFELDIYSKDKNIAIEYDGEYFHKDKKRHDKAKNTKCQKRGIQIYRIRENLPSLHDKKSIDICYDGKDLDGVIQTLIQRIYGVTLDVNTERDATEIDAILQSIRVQTIPDKVEKQPIDSDVFIK